MNLLLYPVKVQGEGAAQEIVKGIEALGKTHGVSVVIVGRGGGSMEDLWAFNDEAVARVIADCPVPVISAVGHETDFTIADFAADVRASTPSHAAEMAVPMLDDLVYTIRQLSSRLRGGADKVLLSGSERLLRAQNRLKERHPNAQVLAAKSKADLLLSRLQNAASSSMTLRTTRLEAAEGKLAALGPAQVLSRGYALALHQHTPVTSAKAVALGQRLQVIFSDGQVLADAVEIKEGNPFGEKSKS